jgi:small GTP-binding protein
MEPPITQKIVFAGLEQAGKTSIINGFLNRFAVVEYKPTINIERKKLTNIDWMGWKITNWDLGGQKSFRQNFLKRPAVFLKAYALFYVIDIQDAERYKESLEYLTEIVNLFAKEKYLPKLLICYHKFDLVGKELDDLQSYQSAVINLSVEIQVIAKNMSPIFYSTTVYDEATINTLFFDNLLMHTPKGKQIQTHIENFTKITKTNTTLLLDDAGLIVGSQFTERKNMMMVLSFGILQLTAIEKNQRYDLNIHKLHAEISYEGQTGQVFIERFRVQDVCFAIVSLSHDIKSAALIEKYISELKNKLNNLFEAYD